MQIKKEYYKRSLCISKLAQYLELNKDESISKCLSYLVSPHGEHKHPFRMNDDEFHGHIEKEILKIENGLDDE